MKRIIPFELETSQNTRFKPEKALAKYPELTEGVIRVTAGLLEVTEYFKALTTVQMHSSDFVDACNDIIIKCNTMCDDMKAVLSAILKDTNDRIKLLAEQSSKYAEVLKASEEQMSKSLLALSELDGLRIFTIGGASTSSTASTPASSTEPLMFNNVNLGTGEGYANSPEFQAELEKALYKMQGKPPDAYLNTLGAQSIYDRTDKITEEGLKAGLQAIRDTSTGRDAIARAAMLLIGGAADAGYRYTYDHHGTYTGEPFVPTSQIVKGGVDCNPFASWIIDKAVPEGAYWSQVEDFKHYGPDITDYTKIQCGDVYSTYISDSKKHVGVIIQNRPEEQKVITAEAPGQDAGIRFCEKTYDELKSSTGIHVTDMTGVYNGTFSINEYRKPAFDANPIHPDWDTYERPW